jgi:hypothetical protein
MTVPSENKVTGKQAYEITEFIAKDIKQYLLERLVNNTSDGSAVTGSAVSDLIDEYLKSRKDALGWFWEDKM